MEINLALKPTGPENILRELRDELDQEPDNEPAIDPDNPEQSTPCDCGECDECMLNEIFSSDEEVLDIEEDDDFDYDEDFDPFEEVNDDDFDGEDEDQ